MSVAAEVASGGGELGVKAAEIRRVALDLQDLLLRAGTPDGIYIVIEDVPTETRLSAGRCNGNETWSLAPGELDGLTLVLPLTRIEPFLLSVRILAPDPCGYDYASTTAKFEIVVCPDREFTVVVPARNSTAGLSWPRPLPVQPSLHSGSTTTADRGVAAVRAEWQVEEEIRSARARAYWESTEDERWLVRESELRAQLRAELAEAEAAWALREAKRVAAVEAHYAARLAASKVRCRAQEEQYRCAPIPAQPVDAERTKLRRFLAKLAPPSAFACTFAATWIL
jgi:hypothetical protein